ncbi:DUF2834 domain-containing protein [Mycolicibacterium rufum]|uniref:DUF2834 domain-containing protein n=1 Tax=Mycolicibacterium rufum TaxID=318424 RepID=A0A9X3BFC3_9MYCO|nr:DUF2834 domain-containing protein [Mycolicibacterium rufum]KGI67854.1 hypothetical protein EU78_10810 [Mycolicibacterium rufum]MCV7070658.1 DUF2834 domain-containing protein [Mycolicibacterium rufum]ULP38839.1 DUF2834 domain-containing protein [Mycolicibacterium rufum]
MNDRAATTAPLPVSSRILCGCYAAVALAALVATWSQNAAYLGDPAHFLTGFVADVSATPAGRSFSADLILVYLSASIFMVSESRRRGIRFVWAYIVLGALIAISATFPLFLLARELRIDRTASPLRAFDVAGLVAVAAVSAGLTVWILA